MGVATLLTAVPVFFVAYFLQILVIIVGASPEGAKLLPVFRARYLELFCSIDRCHGNVAVGAGPRQSDNSNAYRFGSVAHGRRVRAVHEYLFTTRSAGLAKLSAVRSRVTMLRPPGTARSVVGTRSPSVVTIVMLSRAASPRA